MKQYFMNHGWLIIVKFDGDCKRKVLFLFVLLILVM